MFNNCQFHLTDKTLTVTDQCMIFMHSQQILGYLLPKANPFTFQYQCFLYENNSCMLLQDHRKVPYCHFVKNARILDINLGQWDLLKL